MRMLTDIENPPDAAASERTIAMIPAIFPPFICSLPFFSCFTG